jgi:Na+/proline symporter/signal transduction histidine kinase
VFRPASLLLITTLYVGVLVGIAVWVEHGSGKGRRLAQTPVAYSLALAVYCTSWTFYGSVGNAATYGVRFLTIYLGPTLAMGLWWFVLRRLVRIKNSHHITSIADLISARYDKSPALAALATLLALVGTMPYLALQLKAVVTTFTALTAGSPGGSSWLVDNVGMIVVAMMIGFTILFGARRLDATERHEGLLLALAVECLVKLAAFLAVGIFVTFFLFDGWDDLFDRLAQSPFSDLFAGRNDAPTVYVFMTYLVLAMSAIQFLPRQFHMAVVENSHERQIRTAVWLLPLYMLLINVFVIPIAAGGLLQGLSLKEPDSFVLGLPMQAGRPWLSLIVFIGGFSAATGMIIVEAMAVATMVSNHLLMPIIENVRRLNFLRRSLLKVRWVTIAGVLITGYAFERAIGGSFTLVNMGIISFVAVFQFAPPILGGLFWRRANKVGALLGLSAGSLVWFYTLLLPSFVRSGWTSADLLERGPWGIALLRPEQLFGLSGLYDPVVHATFWSFTLNVGLYVLGSLLFQPSQSERRIATTFVGRSVPPSVASLAVSSDSLIALEDKRPAIHNLLSRYFPSQQAVHIMEQCEQAVHITDTPHVSVAKLAELYGELERLLAGFIGAASAHRASRTGLPYTAEEWRALSAIYGKILVDLKVSPEELRQRVNYYQERAALISAHAEELQNSVDELQRVQSELRLARDELENRVQERTQELNQSNQKLREEVAERRRAEEALALSNAELKQFAYIASHDLQEPLRTVASCVQVIESQYKGKLGPEADQVLGFAVDAAKRMRHLINDLLAFAHVGGRDPTLERIDTRQVVAMATENLHQAVEESHAHIICGPLPTVMGHSTQLTQLFQNLIDNAIKFRAERTPEVRIGAELTEGEWLFWVADNGIGIDPKYQDRIFRVFQRLNARGSYPGTGIGLALCKKVVEWHGGRIWVESRLGEGSTFRFTIPQRGRRQDWEAAHAREHRVSHSRGH